ncbi:glutamyl-tRNA synthetase, putative [Trypanosoma equiperdum]|uniref:glutamate--tRNA ligase n=2 Tax=Trypanozoon TaxID=39700 RepID=Q587C5_TRYB2|nr:glutamyl-tRNA synthetase, putative [Trypanosoma brucei brucei TREU927]AAX79252.1 glutamyl-tRNA synthetase, putative [Trypanosoma brucei]AAZ12017.1 glutamyl-tRNA synthetase, putative [Trypanosoma brucei brucei TREU927]SCU66702.1 glutamyl-tRNA synthetase, putative [Trypanosoma equiperdum]
MLRLANKFTVKISLISRLLKEIPFCVMSKHEEDCQKAPEHDKLTLTNAEEGKVVTRFPPEASGFLHIGHAKAALINSMLALKYKGKLVMRFDDTNPSKEKDHFEQAILDDLATLGVTWDVGPTYSSDYMELLYEKADELIEKGLAYCDKTTREEMQKCRFNGVPTSYRDISIEETKRMWSEMKEGSAEGQETCLRAKISVDNENKAMRDPVIYRVNLTPHARQGTKYKAYPTYDFCCPIIDSVEGITHALRTNEYHDRNDQYYWFCDALGLRKPIVEDFSRLNMEYAVMSKRKLTQLIDSKVVDGWDDPRFPTVRALVRRGLKMSALRQFVQEQGMSKTVNFMEWSKLWYFNTQILDPSVPRYTVVSNTLKVRCVVEGIGGLEKCEKLLHKKAPDMGSKVFYKSGVIFLDAEDVALLKEGDEVTLMDWGNAFIRNIRTSGESGTITDADIVLNLEGDVKKTKHKLTWVAENPEAEVMEINEYDHLLTKKKPDPEESLDSILAAVTKYTQEVYSEAATSALKKGDIIQLERRGYYIVDNVIPRKVLIAIPDGREKVNHLSAKAHHLKYVAKVSQPAAANDLAAKRAAKAAKKAAQKQDSKSQNKEQAV